MLRPVKIAVLVFALPFVCSAADLTGQATVIDGDTMEIGGQRVKLHGVWNPGLSHMCPGNHSDYPCGLLDAPALDQYIAGHSVSCIWHEALEYGIRVATCYADGRDLGAMMVESGWARRSG